MNIAQYTFQSPSPSQVQVGKLDPSSVKSSTVEAPVQKNETVAKAQAFVATQVSEVKPTVDSVESAQLLDVYA